LPIAGKLRFFVIQGQRGLSYTDADLSGFFLRDAMGLKAIRSDVLPKADLKKRGARGWVSPAGGPMATIPQPPHEGTVPAAVEPPAPPPPSLPDPPPASPGPHPCPTVPAHQEPHSLCNGNGYANGYGNGYGNGYSHGACPGPVWIKSRIR